MKRVFVFMTTLLLIVTSALPVTAGKRVVKEDEYISVSVSAAGDSTQKKLPIEIKAKAVVLMDVKSGTVLMEHNGDTKLYPASVTKIMTMLLVAESISSKKITLADKVTCSQNAASKGGSQIWLEEGESMTVDELLRATAIGSANDAATLLGEYVSGSETAFIDRMNSRAKELGMKNTNFENATGLDDATEAHLTTARDIAIMSTELLKHEFITDYTTVWMDSLRNGETELVNTNKLVRFYEGTTGLKTGTTAKAGCCVSASAKRDDLHLVAVVMGSDNSADRFETAKAMLNWGFSNYSCFVPKVDKKSVKDVKVIGGKEGFVKCRMPDITPILVKKGEEGSVKVTVKTEESLPAPVKEKQKIGEIKITVGDKTVGNYEITAENAVEKLTFGDCMRKLAEFLANGKKDYVENP